MSFWKIAWRNMQQRALASTLTALSMALGVAVMIAVMLIHSVAVRQFESDAQGYHVIVGGKGGALQLVLSTVYHIDKPLYPIPYTYYQKFLPGGEFAGFTSVAIPMCLGDSYEAPNGSRFRVIGTTPDLFEKLSYGADDAGQPKKYAFQRGGRNFKTANFYEAVVGAVVASQAGLKLGDEVNPTHGLGAEGHQHEGFKVVGILEPTGTSNDRAVFINIEGFYLLEGHAGDSDPHVEEATHSDAPGNAEPHPSEHTEKSKPAESPKHSDEHADEHADEHHHEHELAATGTDKGPTAAHDHDEDHGHEDGHEHEKEHEHEAGHEETHHHGDEKAHAPRHDSARDHAHDHDHEHGHDDAHHHHHEHAPLPIDQRKVTSILVLCNTPFGPTALDDAINKHNDPIAQVVPPRSVIENLFNGIIDPVRIILLVLTVLIVVVAGVSILVSIYNSMSERSHDIAVMRALGASRGAVMSIILFESILLALLGGALGVLLGHVLIGLASPYVVERTGVSLSVFEFTWQELVLIPGLMLLASLVGLLPALAAYRTDVAKSLAGSR